MVVDRLITMDDVEKRLDEFSVEREFFLRPLPRAKAATISKSLNKLECPADGQIRELILQLQVKEYEYGWADSDTILGRI
jgi:hypothetical protein